MDSSNLLVIDNSPDRAQVINSFLRNAGKAVRVTSAANPGELEENLKEHSPFLIVVGTQLPEAFKITQILQSAVDHSTPVVLQASPGNLETLEAAIAIFPVQVINAEENDQLMQVVQQHMSGGKCAPETG